MPELPEVETIVRELRPRLLGETVAAVEVRWPRIVACPTAAEFVQQLPGRQVAQVTRRGKFVVLALHPASYLLVHLRMTGRLLWTAPAVDPAPEERHTHVCIRFTSGTWLHYRNPRKFGRLYLVDDPHEILAGLGPEPLAEDFTVEVLGELLHRHRRRIKPLLLEQRFLAGLGNIYADEALWQAGINPLRQAHTLDEAATMQLHAAIRSVLCRAVENRGTSLRDYRDPQGQPGSHQWALMVYGRAGQSCPRCGQVLRRIVVGGRGTHYCPHCQPDDDTYPGH